MRIELSCYYIGKFIQKLLLLDTDKKSVIWFTFCEFEFEFNEIYFYFRINFDGADRFYVSSIQFNSIKNKKINHKPIKYYGFKSFNFYENDTFLGFREFVALWISPNRMDSNTWYVNIEIVIIEKQHISLVWLLPKKKSFFRWTCYCDRIITLKTKNTH